MKTTIDPLVRLGFPTEDAEPPDDCGVCRALVVQREIAAAARDLTKVTDCNVEIRNHHQPQHLKAAR